MLEPRTVDCEVEFGDGVYVGRKEALKHELTDVIYFVLISTKLLHVEDFDGWAVLYDLSKQTNQRQSSSVTQIIHDTKFEVSESWANVGQSRYYFLLKRLAYFLEVFEDKFF